MKLAPGGLPWLVFWDVRIRTRTYGFGGRPLLALLIYGGLIAAVHGGAWLLLRRFGLNRPIDLAAPALIAIYSELLLLLFAFMLMAAIASSFRLLHSGRALTLQLGSPLPFGRVLLAQVLSLVFSTWSIPLLFAIPVANVSALLGQPVLLLIYPVTIALAVCAQALTLLFASGLLRLFGVVRMRRLMPYIQAIVPLLIVTLNLFERGNPRSQTHNADFGQWFEILAAPMRLPARAIAGEPVALAALLAVAGLLLWLALRAASRGVRVALTTPDAVAAPAARRQSAAAGLRFQRGLLRAMMLKEWRTTVREPRLAISLLATPLFVLPLFYSRLFTGQFSPSMAVVAALLATAQLCQRTANLTISAEEAPALLGSAPQARGRIIAYKCAAALLPVIALMSIAAAWIGYYDPWRGMVCFVCGLGASFCLCAIEVARPYPAPRRSFVQVTAGRRKRNPLDILAILFVELGWAAGAWFLAERSLWGALIVFGVLVVPFLQWWRDANKQSLLGYY
jgi:ABC-2 type transport system permease protein